MFRRRSTCQTPPISAWLRSRRERRFRQVNLRRPRLWPVSVWSTRLDDSVQESLVITPPSDAAITVDDLEVAQFLYLMLDNAKIRNMIAP